MAAHLAHDSGRKADVRSFVFHSGALVASWSLAALYQSHTDLSLVIVPENPLQSYMKATEVWTWNFYALFGVLIGAIAFWKHEKITSVLVKGSDPPSRR